MSYLGPPPEFSGLLAEFLDLAGFSDSSQLYKSAFGSVAQSDRDWPAAMASDCSPSFHTAGVCDCQPLHPLSLLDQSCPLR